MPSHMPSLPPGGLIGAATCSCFTQRVAHSPSSSVAHPGRSAARPVAWGTSGNPIRRPPLGPCLPWQVTESSCLSHPNPQVDDRRSRPSDLGFLRSRGVTFTSWDAWDAWFWSRFGPGVSTISRVLRHEPGRCESFCEWILTSGGAVVVWLLAPMSRQESTPMAKLSLDAYVPVESVRCQSRFGRE